MVGDVGVRILLSSNHRIALENQVYPKQGTVLIRQWGGVGIDLLGRLSGAQLGMRLWYGFRLVLENVCRFCPVQIRLF